MKIAIITGSHRPGSNSGILAEHFKKGAEEAGHSVFLFEAAKRHVHPCIGCGKCGMDGPCIFEDDMDEARGHIIEAQAVVLATPMYYFGLSPQILAVVSRFYSFNPQATGGKSAFLLVAFGGNDPETGAGIEKQYEAMCEFLKWKDRGRILAPSLNGEKEVLNTPFPQKAYDLGLKL